MEDNSKNTLNKYDYYAFISYSTADEKWAKWLHKHLENYNLPSALRRTNNSLPKYIRPVFWYKTDLSGTELHSALERELTSSRHLVLICSPESAKSEWVNDEVKSFVESNRTDSIIPFIVSGQPDKPEDADYCYPPVLRDMPRTQMLRGIDVSKVGKQHALIDVVSTMFGLRFDALWQRHKRARIRKNIGFALLALLLVFAGIGIWDYNRSTYEYYADYVDVYGVPQGVCKLTEDQKNHRQHSFKFEYRRIPFGEPNAYSWRLHSVAYVNSADRLQEYKSVIADRFALQTYFYNKKTGKLSYVENDNHYKMLQCKYLYSKRDGVDACIVDIEGGSKERTLGFSAISSTSMTAEEDKSSNITRFIFLRDSVGHIIRKTFHSNNDYILDRSITADNEGVFGQSYKLDSIGRIIEIFFLNREMEPFQTRGGFSYITFEYDQFSNIKSCTYFNQENCLTQSPNGWAKFIDISDKYGNGVEERTYGTDLKLWKHEGAEIRRWEYDQRGFQTALKLYDDKGNPCMSDYQYSICEEKYDKNGNIIESRYYDSHGKPVMAYDEYATLKMTYDENGNRISFSAYDIKNEPCYVKEGYSKVINVYNDSHNPISQSYFGTDGKPCLRKEGYSKVVNIWDDQNHLIEEQFFGVDGKPCLKKGGLSIVKYAYDERGNKCEESYYGTNGLPILCRNSYHKKITKFNDMGFEQETRFFDASNKPCITGNQYHCRRYTYDNQGNNSLIEYLDTNNNLCTTDEGLCAVGYEYDKNGNVTKAISYDKKDNICKNSYGCSILENEYDNNGNLICQRYYDEKYNLCINDDEGYAIVRYEYNSNGLRTKISYFNEKGKLFLYADDHAIEEKKYDSRYNNTEIRYYDENGILGAKDGIAIQKYKYDERSNLLEVYNYNKRGELCKSEDGISIYKYTYNEKNQESSGTSYGPNRKPILNKYKYCKYTLNYDNRGNVIMKRFYDVNGKPCICDYGYFAFIKKYDERNNLVQMDYFDTKMKPVNNKDGYSKEVYTYSDNFDSRTYKCYNVNGKLIEEGTNRRGK